MENIKTKNIIASVDDEKFLNIIKSKRIEILNKYNAIIANTKLVYPEREYITTLMTIQTALLDDLLISWEIYHES